MFYMFLKSPPPDKPVKELYRELRPFGPYVDSGEQRFASDTLLGIDRSASADLRTVRTICDGWVRIAGVLDGFDPLAPSSPLVVTLTPDFWPARELGPICLRESIEGPRAFIYHGLDRATLERNAESILQSVRDLPGVVPALQERLARFSAGQVPIRLRGGLPLAEVSPTSAKGSTLHIGLSISTLPLTGSPLLLGSTARASNFLDPVVLFHRLARAQLSSHLPAMQPAETQNSWLEIVDQTRVLLTLRDEWNEPLLDPTAGLEIADGEKHYIFQLSRDSATFSVPSTANRITCKVQNRKSSLVSSLGVSTALPGAFDVLDLRVTAPAHYVMFTVNPVKWFVAQNPPLSNPSMELRTFTEGNHVEPLIDGFETFARITDDLTHNISLGHSIFIAGWRVLLKFPLLPRSSEAQKTTLESMLSRLSRDGSMIRALIWDAPTLLNTPAVDSINELETGSAILDKALRPWGSHHWKCTVIRDQSGTKAHLGGIDFNDNRLDGPDHLSKDSRYHDVNCRIEGPAADDVEKAFVDRWNDHPSAGNLQIPRPPVSPVGFRGTCMVQIARTYAAGAQTYAPRGDRTIWATLENAIRRARRYIYIEDQYLVYTKLSEALLSALPLIDNLVIVIDGTYDSDFFAPLQVNIPPQDYDWGRFRFLDPLRRFAPEKLLVFTLANFGSAYKVHTKVVIVDDVFATIGSANMGRRSMTHDSEINAFMLDGKVVNGGRKFARDLRIRLWAEHLGWGRGSAIAEARLGDIDEAIGYLKREQRFPSRLEPYDSDLGSTHTQPPGWDSLADPDGSEPSDS